jgi:hypothetical protein
MFADAAGGRPRHAFAFGNALFVTFALVQLADGLLTYIGITALGLSVEANPLIAWYAAMLGAEVALIGAKTMALLCGVVLHVTARHHVIWALTVVYLLGAIGPWTFVLWP